MSILYIPLYKMVKFNLYFYDLRAVWGHYQVPVSPESNYTSELQGSFGIEIVLGKNYNRPAWSNHLSFRGFPNCQTLFLSMLVKKLWQSLVFLYYENRLQQREPWEDSNTKNLWIFHQAADQNLELNITLHNGYLVQNLIVQKNPLEMLFFLEILQHLPSVVRLSRLSWK